MANSSFDRKQILSAVRSDDYETVRCLLDEGKVDVKQNGSDYLCEAAMSNAVQVIQLLVDRGVNVRSKGSYGWTPLHRAARDGNAQTVELLLNIGADINCVNKVGWTPLHRAVEWGNTQTVELLVNKGAHLNSVDEGGWTPLHCAVVWGNTQTVELLVSKGANLNVVDESGKTALDRCRNKDIKKLLKEAAKKKKSPLKDVGQESGGAKKNERTPKDVGQVAGAAVVEYLSASGTPAPAGPSRVLVHLESEQGSRPADVKRMEVLGDGFSHVPSRDVHSRLTYGPQRNWAGEVMFKRLHDNLSVASSSVVGVHWSNGKKGTGFRVGANEIITNYHVVEEPLSLSRAQEVARQQDRYAVFGFDRPDQWLGAVDKDKMVRINLLEISEFNTFLDIAILRIAPGQPASPALTRFKKLDQQEKIHFCGHPDGNAKVMDTNCSVERTNTADFQRRLTMLRNWSHTNFAGTDVYRNVEHASRALYHNSPKWVGGSSGAPGFVADQNCDVHVAVIHTCQYPCVPAGSTVAIPKDYNVEQGVRVEHVYDWLNGCNPQLCRDIFGPLRPY